MKITISTNRIPSAETRIMSSDARPSRSDSDHDCQHYHSEHVVDDRCTYDDPRLDGLGQVHVLNDPGGDADAGSDQGCGDEQCLGLTMTEGHDERESA